MCEYIIERKKKKQKWQELDIIIYLFIYKKKYLQQLSTSTNNSSSVRENLSRMVFNINVALFCTVLHWFCLAEGAEADISQW